MFVCLFVCLFIVSKLDELVKIVNVDPFSLLSSGNVSAMSKQVRFLSTYENNLYLYLRIAYVVSFKTFFPMFFTTKLKFTHYTTECEISKAPKRRRKIANIFFKARLSLLFCCDGCNQSQYLLGN